MAARDSQWDNREAVVLLNASIPPTAHFLQEPNHYFMARGHGTSFPDDDFYSLYSNHRRGLLPSADSGGGNSGDSQVFLLALPEPPASNAATPKTTRRRSIPPGGDLSNGRTITLGALKGIIGTVMAEYNGGDGSEAYKKCVRDKYEHLTLIRNSPTVYGDPYTALDTEHTLGSGQAAGTRVSDVVGVDDYVKLDTYYNLIERMWLTGTDAPHFEALQCALYAH